MCDSQKYQRILIIKLGALGDIIRSLYTMYAIRKHFPNAKIDLLTRKPFVSFCQTIPWISEVHAAPNLKARQVGQWWNFSRYLRGQKFDLVVDLQCKLRTTCYHLLFGFRGPDWSGTSPFSTFRREADVEPKKHPYVIQRRQLESMNIPPCDVIDLDWLSDPLPPVDLPARFVIMVPGCSVQHPYKRWPAESYAALSQKLQDEGIGTIVIGTTAEKETIDALVSLAPQAINLMNQTSMKQLASLARLAMVVISNDTGPAHLTAMVGAPTFVIMSRVTIPERMLPIGPKVAFIKKEDITDINVDEVLSALKQNHFV